MWRGGEEVQLPAPARFALEALYAAPILGSSAPPPAFLPPLSASYALALRLPGGRRRVLGMDLGARRREPR